MSKTTTVLPKKNTLRKLLWGLVFLALVMWVIKHPYQARDAVQAAVHALSVLFSGSGGGR
ncbi:hypothetical protein LWP59_27640 [Amycolatopsis acidiphila]|uniref:Uncharacterized protein n=1 Tax=Amycolatopsis acidiphila TaxID=715473 RepID=A0A558A136_9PSEU|nr:hypothetical protein [Amycolatopsis acidiphila]TVT17966.1 hypothetical protein FNH06_29535 [Amycolatopsis acidiphila]UIJ57866.1 hypothetical protein LWP59_27520 [Amycolatopsis acidiphila]UIJ57889.1 hypothetical protein LWP59_27640 [Amycolatopsis acidiphila]GHG71317.1 hypothetical protein GCM10017788_33150 [Amycolatopsis acidiphila]